MIVQQFQVRPRSWPAKASRTSSATSTPRGRVRHRRHRGHRLHRHRAPPDGGGAQGERGHAQTSAFSTRPSSRRRSTSCSRSATTTPSPTSSTSTGIPGRRKRGASSRRASSTSPASTASATGDRPDRVHPRLRPRRGLRQHGPSNGQPEFFESEIPAVGGLDVAQPRVYFGELPRPTHRRRAGGNPTGRARLPDDASPTGQANNTYTGAGGVPIGSPLDRRCSPRSSRTRTSCSPTWSTPSRGSCGTATRRPGQDGGPVADHRLQDPYPIVADGRMMWIVDGYTTLDNYPYSQLTSASATQRTPPRWALPNTGCCPTSRCPTSATR